MLKHLNYLLSRYKVWMHADTAKDRVPRLLGIVAFQKVESGFVTALENDERFKSGFSSSNQSSLFAEKATISIKEV